MRDYNRPQMRGYWDAPKSKDDSRSVDFAQHLLSSSHPRYLTVHFIRDLLPCDILNYSWLRCLWKFVTLETRGIWAEFTFANASGIVVRDREKIRQQLTGASSVTIPETIAGRSSCLIIFKVANRTKEIGYSSLNLKAISFPLFPRASESSMNFIFENISEVAYWR